MSLELPRVAIVGSGLGGLCLAQGLHRAGIPFAIYEKDPRFDSRTQGYRLRIDAGGQRALASCLSPALYAVFRDTCARTSTLGRFVDPQLQPIGGRPATSWQPAATDDEADGDRSADRRTLRELLLCGIAERVELGRGVRGFERGARGARLTFDDATASPWFDVIVGADGVHSAIRAARLPDAQPADTGAICIYGKADLDAEGRAGISGALVDGTHVVFADGFAVVIDAMRFRGAASTLAAQHDPTWKLSDVDDYVYWAVIGPRKRLGVERAEVTRVARGALQRAVARATSHWAPALRAVFAHTRDASIAATLVRSATTVDDWVPDCVTVLGDAIHVMSPAGGLGANTALADAAMLTRGLRDATTSTALDAIRAYEADMRIRARAAIDSSQAAARRLFEA